MERRVVITGLGPVTSVGVGKEAFFKSILEHKPCIKEIPQIFELNYTYKSRYYSPFPDFLISDYGFSPYYNKLVQLEDKIALLGTKLALEDAGFTIKETGKNFEVEGVQDCGIILGIGISGLETAFISYLAHIIKDSEKLAELFEGNRVRYNRMTIPMTMPNSIAAWTSILFNLKECSYTINASCASGTFAIGEAYRRIKNGYNNMLISGGSECLKDKLGSIMRGFDLLDALTKSNDGLPVPFSKKRSGFLFADGGGCILILEELEQALKRGANIYTEIVNFKVNSDAYNIIQIDISGTQIVRLLKDLKGQAEIDYLNTHGTGTSTNDEIESKAIIEVFGNKKSQPYINSTKGILGHTIGASGAIEAAVTALSIKRSKIHGNLVPEPIDNLNIVTKSIDKEINYAISTSYGFGGHNAGLLFKRYSG